MNILITGITGFTGSHLAEYIVKQPDVNVFGTIRGRHRQLEFINHIKDKLTLLECDLTDTNAVIQTIDDCEPDMIFHLAAQSFVPTSWRAPQETFNSNVLGTLNLLEVVRKSRFNPKILITGSSEEYGLVFPEEIPIKETNQLRPLSPYAVSKVAQDLLGFQYHQSYGMKIVRTRCFNIIGPRSGSKIVSANFAIQIAEIEKYNKEPVIYVGNLTPKRDFVDVRDIAKAYFLALTKCKSGEVYNICSEKAIEIKYILDTYLKLSKVKIVVKEDPARMRPSDVPLLLGDCSKFKNETNWKPEYNIDQSLRDVLNYWRENV
ncbi:MAG: GDP-mannose 4,6-dehydratase [Candidatus Aenigmatarchaeota archaeon]